MNVQSEHSRMAASIAKLYADDNLALLPDLIQEANLAVLETLRSLETKQEKPKSLKAYLRLCVHNQLKDYLHTNSFDKGMLSLDEEIGFDEDDNNNPVTRLDTLGTPASQEDNLVKEEKKKVQAKVAQNRIQAVKKNPGGQSRIDEIVSLKESGLTDKEISSRLGVSRQAVSKSLSKLRKRNAA